MNTITKHCRLQAMLALALFCGAFVSVQTESASAADNSKWGIYLIRPDGREERLLVAVDSCLEHTSPRWSHDGTRIAFAATPSGWSANNIYIVNVDGSGLRTLGPHVRPDWSPDDKQVVFDQSLPGGNAEVFVQDVQGRGRTNITSGVSPRWSPDGSVLAVSDATNVFVIDLVTGETHNILARPVQHVFDGFCWSPDGSQLAVVVRPKQGDRRHCLFINPAGDNQGVRDRVQGEMGGHVSFSPGGKQLVYSDGLKLRIIEVEGKRTPSLVPNQKRRAKHPHWSPDGEWIVFSGELDRP